VLLLYLSLSWIAGIYWGSQFFWPWIYISAVIFIFCFFLSLWRRKGWFILISVCLLSFSGGLALSHFYFADLQKYGIAYYQGQVIEIRGRLDQDPQVINKGQRFFLAVEEIRLQEKWDRAKGRVLVWSSPFPLLNYGDLIEVKGKLEEGEGISGVLFYPQMRLLSRHDGSPVVKALYSLRQRLSRVLSCALPEPQGSLAQGLLLGIRGNIPQSLRDTFSRTGTAHLLAISGLHMSILAGILLSVSAWVFGRHRPIYILIALLGLWLYAFLTGLRPPALRAGIMGTIFLVALFLGRPRSGIVALSFAAALMVGLKPLLLWDVSFQLSFLAMAGLLLIAPLFQAWGRKTPLPLPVIDSLAFTSGAIIATWPLVAHYFRMVSLVGLPATFFALPSLPFIIPTSAMVGVMGLICMPLAKALGWIDWLFLSYLIAVVEAFSSLPKAFLEVKSISSHWIYGYYFALGLLFWFPRRRLIYLLCRFKEVIIWLYPRLPKRGLALSLLLIAILIWTAFLSLPDPRLIVSFLDVGNGDAILIQKGMRQILIDGGPHPQALTLALGERLPFWDKTIDLVVLTHPDTDHLWGLLEVLDRYKVNKVLQPPIFLRTPIYKEWHKLIHERRIPVVPATSGQKIVLGDIELYVLHPQEKLLRDTEDDFDNNSVVLKLVMGEVSFLFTGDLREEGERELLLQRARLKSTVLKVAHHGSQTSTSAPFLTVVNPSIAVISVGQNNPFGHPHPEVVQRLRERLSERVYLTSEKGTIDLFTDGKRLWLKTEK